MWMFFASIISAKGMNQEQFEWTILMLIVNQVCGFFGGF
jgi:hypothetical protein